MFIIGLSEDSFSTSCTAVPTPPHNQSVDAMDLEEEILMLAFLHKIIYFKKFPMHLLHKFLLFIAVRRRSGVPNCRQLLYFSSKQLIVRRIKR